MLFYHGHQSYNWQPVYKFHLDIKKKYEYDQEMPQSHIADQPMALWGTDIEH